MEENPDSEEEADDAEADEELKSDPPPSLPPSRRVAWLLAKGRPAEAVALVDQLQNMSAGVAQTKVELLGLKAAAWTILGDTNRADVAWKQTADLARGAGAHHLMVRASAARAFLWLRTNARLSLKIWDQCVDSLTNAVSSSELARSLNVAALAHLHAGNTPEAEEAWELALRHSESGTNAAIDRAVCAHNLGAIRLRSGLEGEDPAQTAAAAEAQLQAALRDTTGIDHPPYIRASLLLMLARLADLRDDGPQRELYSSQYRDLLRGTPQDTLETFGDIAEAEFAVGLDGLAPPQTPRILEYSDLDLSEPLALPHTSTSDTASPPTGGRRLDTVHETDVFQYLRLCAFVEDWPAQHLAAAAGEEAGTLNPPVPGSVISELFENESDRRLIKSFQDDLVANLLVALPSSGRLPCWTNANSTLRIRPPSDRGSRDAERRNSSETYDQNRFPSGLFLPPSAFPVLMSEQLPTLHVLGSVAQGLPMEGVLLPTISQLHACGFDREVWQLTERALATSWLRDEMLLEALRGVQGRPRRDAMAASQELANEEHLTCLRRADALFRIRARGVPLEPREEAGHNELMRETIMRDVFSAMGDALSTPPPIPTLELLSTLLGPEEVYVSLMDEASFGSDWLITSVFKGADGSELSVRSERITMPSLLLSQFSGGILAGEASMRTESLMSLGQRLFARLFPGETGNRLRRAKRIIFAPAADAWTIPYGALIIEGGSEPRFLGLEKPISLVESAIVLRELEKPWHKPSGKPLVIGAIAYTAEGGQSELPAKYGVNALSDLPANAKAVREIATLLHADLLTAREPQEDKVRSMMSTAPLVHIASHGFSIEVGFARSPVGNVLAGMRADTTGIWLAPNAKPGVPAGNDGLLQAWEVRHHLDCTADLVVLAACEVGSPRGGRSTGPDLPVAFLRAGARSVLAPLARVDDESTAHLMTGFYEGLRKGLRKDEALRLAMRTVSSSPSTRHPLHWATFQLIGSTANRINPK